MLFDIRPEDCGVKSQHPAGLCFEAYRGDDQWFFTCFRTPFLYRIQEGEICRGEMGDCIILPPRGHLFHGSDTTMEQGFCNDWLYMRGEGISRLIETYQLPVGRIFNVGDCSCMQDALEEIEAERRDHYAGFQDKMEILAVKMLADLSVALRRNVCGDANYHKFCALRSDMLRRYASRHSVEKLAARSGYCSSRFLQLYRQYFHASPIDELVTVRLQKAQRLLFYADMTVDEVSAKCGFSSASYFSRMFKKRYGCPPTKFWDQQRKRRGIRLSDGQNGVSELAGVDSGESAADISSFSLSDGQ